MMEMSFEIRITGVENGEWQGYITQEDKPELAFSSVLELLRMVSEKLEGQALS